MRRRLVVLYQPRDRFFHFPLGLLRAGSGLPASKVAVVDGRVHVAPEALVAELAKEAVCLGVGVRTGPPLADAVRISRAARAANPRLLVLWGGPHATERPEECLATGIVSACARGAGEESFAELLAEVAGGNDTPRVEGIATPGCPGERRLVPPADRWPRADYEVLALERYFEVRQARRVDYSSSRGGAGDGWTGLPAESVVAELSELAARHALREVAFHDQDFFGDPARALAIAAGLSELGLRLLWTAAGTPASLGTLDAGALRALAGGGCRRVRVETKGASAEREALAPLAEALLGAGIGARFTFLLRHDRAKLEAAFATARWLRCMGAGFDTRFVMAAPYPGSSGAAPGFRPPERVEEWAGLDLEAGRGAWAARGLAERARRYDFYLAEAHRAPGGRLGKRLVRGLARARLAAGVYAWDVERRAIEWSARLRTGRERAERVVRDD